MAYINVRVGGPNGNFASKKAFKETLAGDPGEVMFSGTSLFEPFGPMDGHGVASALGSNRLTVVGPDPYTKRTWYATVSVRNGALRVE